MGPRQFRRSPGTKARIRRDGGTTELDAKLRLNDRQIGPNSASPTGWCPPHQRGTPGTRIFRGCWAIM